MGVLDYFCYAYLAFERRLKSLRTKALIDREFEVEFLKLKKSHELLLARYDELLNNSSKIMYTSEILECLDNALLNAENELDILSPWVSGYVLSKKADRLKKLLEKGVAINIITGLNPNLLYRNSSIRAFYELERLQCEFPLLHIKRSDKTGGSNILLCDNRFYLITGFNLLGIDEEADAKEAGVRGQDPVRIKLLRKNFFCEG